MQGKTAHKKEPKNWNLYNLTIYHTVILVRIVIQFLDRNFLCMEKVKAFLDLTLSRALTRVKV